MNILVFFINLILIMPIIFWGYLFVLNLGWFFGVFEQDSPGYFPWGLFFRFIVSIIIIVVVNIVLKLYLPN